MVAKSIAASGFIFRNEEGQIIGSEFRTNNLVKSVVMAEAIAMLHGIPFALEMGFMLVILERDSKIVIKNVQSTEEDFSETRPITWDVNALARNFLVC